jgi:hypothetical protein
MTSLSLLPQYYSRLVFGRSVYFKWKCIKMNCVFSLPSPTYSGWVARYQKVFEKAA